MPPGHSHLFRVRYSDVDAMGTYYNSRVFEWFEWGRTELCRALGKPYGEWERDGVCVPVIEAHAEYVGRAGYDDELRMTTTASMPGRARLRFDVEIVQAGSGRPVCRGYTLHVVADLSGRPIRPPPWLLPLLSAGGPLQRP